MTCTLDLAFLEETFSWRFSQNSEEEKISKASYQTIPVSKSTLGLQLLFHKIVFVSSELSENPNENVPFAAWSFQRLQFYQIYGTIFLIYLYQNDHTRKENKIQSI